MMRRAIIIAALIVCTQACAARQPVTNDDNAATRAADITRTYGLSKDRTECLLFDTADKGEYFLVRVRENHTQACGGATGVSPTLFFLKIRKRDGYTVTTAYDGEQYLPLKTPAKN
ncbi:hypothetical protein R69658_05375 [Paraburkholderia aspalathi]|uniref:Lipoprotein n=1 Tax=Paraburkholderia aspalathi TaxID=1324617 RepID=A0ABN7MMB6_9BURK|nr:hypothetical protein [Paraburkholderia aspalathi]MBK3821752.1 hypothetical protein [Paraburkholderia aspalathi]MBK3833644.1 hypothetical protein [Paraburkholderia aspalathi]MBK3863367.1 hypothetical protein [Paraburkholderia aspalathi]CAE6810452.1 hypothetical protein R69658_05375 [Paraburkholderia aspalathi]